MLSFKCISLIAFLTTFTFLGCKAQRYTTKFEFTPSIEDSVTNPEKLSKELEERLQVEDEKRIKMLQEKAKEKRAEKKAEETKDKEHKEIK